MDSQELLRHINPLPLRILAFPEPRPFNNWLIPISVAVTFLARSNHPSGARDSDITAILSFLNVFIREKKREKE